VPSTANIERLATGELNEPLALRRILRQPRWFLDDLAPTPAELRHPLTFARGVALWSSVRQQGFTMIGCRRGRTLFRLAAEVGEVFLGRSLSYVKLSLMTEAPGQTPSSPSAMNMQVSPRTQSTR
jgi:hypothetical protein